MIRINSSIARFVRCGQTTMALQLFSDLHRSHHLTPDQYSLSSTITASGSSSVGTQFHSYAIRSGLDSFSHVTNSLVSFYARNRDPDSAQRVFDEITLPDSFSFTTLISAYMRVGRVGCALGLFSEFPKWDVSVWNAVLTGFVDNGHRESALEMFMEMHRIGVEQDQYGYACVISICDSCEMIEIGRQVHCTVFKTGFVNVKESVVSALITMYFRCGVIEDACAVFGEAIAVRDRIMYNSFITGLADCGHHIEALLTLKNMLRERKMRLRPNELTFLSIMSCCCFPLTRIGGQLHALAIKMGLGDSSLVGNAAISMYFRCGDSFNARLIFNEIKEKDLVSWNSLISGYSQQGCYESAMTAYNEMQRGMPAMKTNEFTLGSLIPTARCKIQVEMFLGLAKKNGLVKKTHVCNSLISTLAKLGEADDAHKIFSSMTSRNLISWNSVSSGYLFSGSPVKSLELLGDLVRSELKPNPISLSISLSSVGIISAPGIRYGKQIHAYIIRFRYDENLTLQNDLISMYAKCGCSNSVWSAAVFKRMCIKDVVSWNAMIAAYAQHGDGEEAVLCFKEMQQDSEIEPDVVTFTIILSACSHCGLVEEACRIFSSMIEDYGIEPGVDHYSCIIDVLSRNGYLDEVEKIVCKFGESCRLLDSHIWWALLSACSFHGNLKLGRIAAARLLEMEPESPAVYVLLSNLNAASGQWEEASHVREQMKQTGVIKRPGFSWLDTPISAKMIL